MSRRLSTDLAISTGSAFAFFPTLPAEIRLTVWKFALPGARVLQALFNRKDGNKLKINQPLPTFLLSACHESRLLVLETYTTNNYQNAYIDWNIDTLRMPLSKLSVRGMQKFRWGKYVKYLVLDCDAQTMYIDEAVRYLLQVNGATPSLKTIIFEEVERDPDAGDPKYAYCSACSQVMRELLGDGTTIKLLDFADKSYRVILEKSKDRNAEVAGLYCHFMKWIEWYLVGGARREALCGVLFTLVKSKN